MSRSGLNFYELFVFVLFLNLTGCHADPEPEPIICSCEAKVSSIFNNVQGIMVNTIDGFVFLSPFEGYYEVCNNVDPTLAIDGLMVTVGGELKSTCVQEHDVVFKSIDYSFVNLNSWDISEDSLFNALPIEIHIREPLKTLILKKEIIPGLETFYFD